MEKINILHLSDLHIGCHDDTNNIIIRNELIKDIIKTINENTIEINIIVLSGDIINKGDINAYPIAETIISDILKQVGIDGSRLLIVPGNHDIPKNEWLDKLKDQMMQEEYSPVPQYEPSWWSIVKPRFEGFSKFVHNMTKNQDEMLSYGIGTTKIQIGATSVLFCLLNTAFFCKGGKDDYKQIGVSRWQLEQVRQQLIKNNSDGGLHIVVSHHPFDWLKYDQEMLVEDYLTNKRKINTAIIMHGHVHDAKISSNNTPDGAIVELVTGIGYPEADKRSAGQPKIENCRYSIYQIDQAKKEIYCICRKSTNKGYFITDTSLYENCNQRGHYAIPMSSVVSIEEIETRLVEKSEIEKKWDVDSIPITKGWSGRKTELETLENEDYNILVLSGVGGQGKTGLAAEFLRRKKCSSLQKFSTYLWADCRELPDTMHLKIQQLLEAMSEGRETVIRYKDESITSTINRFMKHIQHKTYLIVFDNVDAYVNIDTEEFTIELKQLIDAILNSDHKSKIILTCRVPVYESKANFKNIKLAGLNEPEGIEFFKKRGIQLDSVDEIICCKNIINSTKGHPWWLGLIAGQVASFKNSFTYFLAMYGDNLLSRNSEVQGFFESIWKQLGTGNKGSISQNVLRLLAESTKPLSHAQINVLSKENYRKTVKIVTMLEKIGLLELHEDTEQDTFLFQVHPLVREYIHGKYTIENQKSFFHSILTLYLGGKIITALFNRAEYPDDKHGIISIPNIVNAIDTCITSRNYSHALELFSQYYWLLRDNGCHIECASLACRIYKAIDWETEQVTKTKRLANALSNVIYVLSNIGDEKNKNLFLQLYYNSIEKGTISYSGYISTVAFIEWHNMNYDKALEYVDEYNELTIENSDLWNFHEIETTKALSLRDKGEVDRALKLFQDRTETDNASILGNIARCYQKKEMYPEAIQHLNQSLKKMKSETTLIDRINEGYAYLWLSEIYKKTGEKDQYEKCVTLYKDKWEEFAPGLLGRIKEIDS